MHPNYIDLIDTHTPGPRYDVTPLFANHAAFEALVGDLVAQLETIPIDIVTGIDALGFILGAAIALKLRKGFVPLRKGGKLPVPTDARAFIDYSGTTKSLELRLDALRPGMRILVVDEWIETGAQVRAAVELIEAQEAIVVAIATIHMDKNEHTDPLAAAYPCIQVWPGEV